MPTADLILGFIITKLLSKPEARSPAVVFPPQPGGGTPPTTTTTSTPAALPPFPAQVNVPEPAKPAASVPPGFKRAIEVWIVQPTIARQASSVLVGAPQEVAVAGAALTLQALESQFPKGWQGARGATAEEAANAKALLPKWRDGGVVFMGPPTLTGRRAYRMTKHPASTVPATAQPAPTAPPVTAPASFPSTASFPSSGPAPAAAPAAAPATPNVTTLPEILITADAPAAPAAAPSFVQQVTAVRRGEGLAQVAKRLGKPENAASAIELKKANVPNGPDAAFQPVDLSKGGLKKVGRAGGLQPGDRLFVPASWGPVDVSRL